MNVSLKAKPEGDPPLSLSPPSSVPFIRYVPYHPCLPFTAVVMEGITEANIY